jgi:hypothetical protein
MKVESQAGKFILSFEEIQPGDGQLVITGKMGVWEATTFMSLPEMLHILRLTLRPRVLGFLIRSLFTGGFRARPEGDA